MFSRSKWRYWAPLALWMALIFSASSRMGSSTHTSRIIGPILRFLIPDIRPETIAACQFVIRKTAHVTEYAILALLTVRALEQKELWPNRVRPVRLLGLALLVTACYAVTDEVHQFFVAGRDSSVRDVLLDTLGGLAALGVLQWHGWRCGKRSGGV